jgi:hypothetical protein
VSALLARTWNLPLVLQETARVSHEPGASGPRDAREYSFTDLLTIRHVAGELELGTPLRVILRAVLAEREGQLQLDFRPGHSAPDTPRAKVLALGDRKGPRSPAQRPSCRWWTRAWLRNTSAKPRA